MLDYLAYVHRHLLALIVLTEIETRCQEKRAYAYWVELFLKLYSVFYQPMFSQDFYFYVDINVSLQER